MNFNSASQTLRLKVYFEDTFEILDGMNDNLIFSNPMIALV
jgi:hypothetical protein